MKQSIIIFLFSVLLTMVVNIPLSAQEVSVEEAYSKALRFLNKHREKTRALNKKTHLELASSSNECFVFNDVVNGGFVIVSGDERLPDILCFSLRGCYEEQSAPSNQRKWIEYYKEQITYLKLHPQAKVKTRGTTNRVNITPLLNCWFSQRQYYNEKCPVIEDNKCPTGCGATAMAQVMHYYQWPLKTTEVIPGYTTYTNKIEMPSIPVSSIDWANICNEYDGVAYSNEQIDAISTLMQLCGSSVQMDYKKDESISALSKIKYAFAKYFSYDDLIECLHRKDYDDEEWDQIIYDELYNKHPVLYEGHYSSNYSGHFFIIDGYSDGYYHINWGWGGVESYVIMTSVEGWYDYTYDQYAAVGIKPINDNSITRYGILSDGKITLYYDNKKGQREGTAISCQEDWRNYSDVITECSIDPSFSELKMKSYLLFFSNLKKLKFVNSLENLNTSNAKSIAGMFYECNAITSVDISSFNTENVIDMSSLFYHCSSLLNVNVGGINTDRAQNMSSLFCGCSKITSIDVSEFNTENVTDMNSMFWGCSNLKDLDVSNFTTSKVVNMNGMFLGCSRLETINLSGLNTSNVENMNNLFNGCSSINELNLSDFKTNNVKYMDRMFNNCLKLKTIYASELWDTSIVEKSSDMFSKCSKLVGEKGTAYDSNYTNVEYARIDDAPNYPGYFTYRPSALGMCPIDADENNTKWFDLNGKQISVPQKGINIKLFDNGNAKKVVIK